jgi:malonate-semialdehyde dehydrogenase (acetylating)/methylmalonate-semialdehyde dehydrogenase
MTSTAEPRTTTKLPLLISNQWTSSSTSRWGDVFNPSTGQTIARVPLCTTDEADAAVRAAHAALPEWSAVPVVERVRVLYKFREILLRRFEELARTVTREHGKTLVEARASVQRGVEVVEFACGIPSLIMGQSIANIARNVDCETVRHPVGVCVGITPFNFPAMVPMWMFPVAIACGNTFVLKPSERVPMSANLLGEMMLEAGCPAGVFNIVHGDKEVVDALLTHEWVKAISFVGSCPTPTSTRPPRPCRRRRSGAPVNGAWPGASPSRSGASPTRWSIGFARSARRCAPARPTPAPTWTWVRSSPASTSSA